MKLPIVKLFNNKGIYRLLVNVLLGITENIPLIVVCLLRLSKLLRRWFYEQVAQRRKNLSPHYLYSTQPNCNGDAPRVIKEEADKLFADFFLCSYVFDWQWQAAANALRPTTFLYSLILPSIIYVGSIAMFYILQN